MKKKHTILIIDDNEVNRKILYRILKDQYIVLQAKDGLQAIDILNKKGEHISAILLDLIMPVMDGYAFLTSLKGTTHASIPIIVTTANRDVESEKKAFSLGACDFVSKPYDPQILVYRLESAIAHNENIVLEKIKQMAEHDELTGLYNRNKFFEETKKMIDENQDLAFAFIRVDVDRFSLVNTFFGNDEGDNLLIYIGKHFESSITTKFKKVTYGRIEADEFALCCSYHDINELKELIQISNKDLRSYNLNFEIVLSFGIYLVVDKTISPRQMLDYAKLAAKGAKGHFSNNYAFYDKTMSAQLIAEQEIINEMNFALSDRQFCIYLQPKYDLKSNLPVGAEALVRWNHPKKGLILPGKFIPIFEKNGFIAKLDYYVWEETCILLERLYTQNDIVLPISVNVSRVHLYDPQLPELLSQMLDRHHLPHQLLSIELTESIYAEHSSVIQATISKLHEHGFKVMMDDFGSGYSSLNVLKDVDFDVLKIDMRFFEKSAIKGRRENIIASIIRMAKWLGLPTVAEGVEKKEQVIFLRDLGCEFVQGYYFAKPMPVDEYVNLLSNLPKTKKIEDNEFKVNQFWKNNDQIELMFSVIPQALILFEFRDNNVELLRANKPYHELFGYENLIINSLVWDKILNPSDKKILWSAIHKAIDKKDISKCIYLRKYKDGSQRWIHVQLRYINSIGNRQILFGILTDISGEIEAKAQLRECKAKQQRLEKEHHYLLRYSKKDSLTDVFNRMATENLINERLRTRPYCTHGLFMLDLDNFKAINDNFGHIVGDRVLKEIAKVLNCFFRKEDIIGRLGGDEFVVFMSDVDTFIVQRKAQEICALIAKSLITDQEIHTTISIGVCLSNPESDFIDLYNRADKALYEAKRSGKHQSKLYSDEGVRCYCEDK